MPSMVPRAALSIVALAIVLGGCRSTPRATPPPAPPWTAADPSAATERSALAAGSAQAPALPGRTATTSAVEVPGRGAPIAVEPYAPQPGGGPRSTPPEADAPASGELRPAVVAPPLPGDRLRWWASSTPSAPIAPVAGPAVPAAPLVTFAPSGPASRPPTPSTIAVDPAPPPTVSLPLTPTAPGPAPASAIPPPRPAAAPPVPTPAAGEPTPAAPAAAATWPSDPTELLTVLRDRAASGQEPELASHVDLLDAALAALPTVTTELSCVRMKDFEMAEEVLAGRGVGWSTLSSYVEPGGDATAMRRSYLDFDRLVEYTGKPGTRTLRREGDVTYARTDAERRVLSMDLGTRWNFRAKSLDRGTARIVVTAQIPADDTAHMIRTRGVMIAMPSRDGLIVIEASASLLDFTIPALIRPAVASTAIQETQRRIQGIRAHWRDYVK